MTQNKGMKYLNTILVNKSLNEAFAETEKNLENADVSTLAAKFKNYVEQVIEPQRPGETRDVFKVRVFADLLRLKQNTPLIRGLDLSLVCAREAVESECKKIAQKWYLQMILDTAKMDPSYWLLYATFCLRENDFETALACTEKALKLDKQNRLAMFVLSSILMITVERVDELEVSLNELRSNYPNFSEAHFLTALHNHVIEMPLLVSRSIETAEKTVYVNTMDDHKHPIHYQPLTVWERVYHHGDPVVKCVVLLLELELVELAKMCMSMSRPRRDDHYHYLMAVVHFKSGEPRASIEHLNSMEKKNDEKWLFLAGHNEYLADHRPEAMEHYAQLYVLDATISATYTLAYLRLGNYYMSKGKYVEASEMYYRICSVVRTPTLTTKLGACLIALNKVTEAEKWLKEAVTIDSDNGEAWYYLAVVSAKLGQGEMEEVCRARAIELGFKTSDIGLEFDNIHLNNEIDTIKFEKSAHLKF